MGSEPTGHNAAAVDLEGLAAAEWLHRWLGKESDGATGRYDEIGDWFHAETGIDRPGRSVPMECYAASDDVREKSFREWCGAKQIEARVVAERLASLLRASRAAASAGVGSVEDESDADLVHEHGIAWAGEYRPGDRDTAESALLARLSSLRAEAQAAYARGEALATVEVRDCRFDRESGEPIRVDEIVAMLRPIATALLRGGVTRCHFEFAPGSIGGQDATISNGDFALSAAKKGGE